MLKDFLVLRYHHHYHQHPIFLLVTCFSRFSINNWGWNDILAWQRQLHRDKEVKGNNTTVFTVTSLSPPSSLPSPPSPRPPVVASWPPQMLEAECIPMLPRVFLPEVHPVFGVLMCYGTFVTWDSLMCSSVRTGDFKIILNFCFLINGRKLSLWNYSYIQYCKRILNKRHFEIFVVFVIQVCANASFLKAINWPAS